MAALRYIQLLAEDTYCYDCHDMTQIYVTYHEVVCDDMTVCHDIKGVVLNFGSFEAYTSTNFIKELPYVSY